MKCLYPNYMVDTHRITPNGKRDLIFVGSEFTFLRSPYANVNEEDVVVVPCGQCENCRLNRSKDWAVRIVAESLQYKYNYFVTLTYNDEYNDFSLHKAHLQAFMKRLREYYSRHFNHTGIRFFACGEYGDTTFRPHYHLCIMNLPIKDLEFYKYNNLGMPLYNSKSLCELWGMSDFVVVGELNAMTAAYTARYCLKKLTGDLRHVYDDYGIEPVFSLMSNRPGLGYQYIIENFSNIFTYDQVFLPTAPGSLPLKNIPRYYKKIVDNFAPDLVADSSDRLKNLAEIYANNTLSTIDIDAFEYDLLHFESVQLSRKLLTRSL